jgi:predicted N-formylglutamate amidohydrolase
MLLAFDEPGPFRILRESASSPYLLTADHAGRVIPRALHGLGLTESDLVQHIAWDISIAGVTERLSKLLNATAVLQPYSRLVIDCNRRPDLSSAFPEVSEWTTIPGNQGLSITDQQLRHKEIFEPYHRTIKQVIETREASGRDIYYIAMHSFTPVYKGVTRPMHVAVLYNRLPRLSRRLAHLLRTETNFVVTENKPYRVTDETDYGVPVHAEQRGLDYIEIEIRHDLIMTESGQNAWATLLARLLPMAISDLELS